MGRDAVNAVPKGLLVGGIIAACVVALAAGAWVLLRILNPISSTVTGIAFAILLTSLLIPAHRLVRKVIRNNHAAAGLTVVGFIVFVLGLTGLAGAQIVTGFGVSCATASSTHLPRSRRGCARDRSGCPGGSRASASRTTSSGCRSG